MRSAAAVRWATAAMLACAALPCGAQDAPSCRAPNAPAIRDSRAALERDPAVLASRFRLADALTEQECYADAVHVLEAGEPLHPDNPALEARLRSARSMISEQNYIESVTRAEEGARLQRNQLRCRKLADVAACDEALALRRNDPELLAARAAAVAQKGEPATAAAPPAALARNDTARPAGRAERIASVTPKPKPVLYSNEAPASRSN